jgi:hypothetical protein
MSKTFLQRYRKGLIEASDEFLLVKLVCFEIPCRVRGGELVNRHTVGTAYCLDQLQYQVNVIVVGAILTTIISPDIATDQPSPVPSFLISFHIR